ncbi:MAG: NAD-dependent epimerase/dehydratase family protein, partial [Actinobacteria bacterium]|nr:NAD-dependent epimerase/dehydratase family protein [Actinomycetota bacterium]
MRTLVTGGAGFIGSNLVDALLARGDEVTVLDNISTGRRVNLDGALANGARLAEVDVRDDAGVGAVFADARPELVFHLAAQIDVRKSVEDPYFDAAVNVGGTANVLEAARATGVDRVIFVSTGGALYGEGADKQLPLPESTPIAPLSGYGQSKYAAEGYLGLFERLHGLSGMSLRLGNVYGPRQDPLGEAGVVAIFCGLLKNGGRPTVYGDGTQTRDYIYVGDVVSAALAAGATRLGGAVNIGTGREASVLDLVEILSGIEGRDDFTPEFAPERPGEVQ